MLSMLIIFNHMIKMNFLKKKLILFVKMRIKDNKSEETKLDITTVSQENKISTTKTYSEEDLKYLECT